MGTIHGGTSGAGGICSHTSVAGGVCSLISRIDGVNAVTVLAGGGFVEPVVMVSIPDATSAVVPATCLG